MRRLAPALLIVITFACLPLRPLWVDEIFQLEGTWGQSFPQMMHNALVAPGGMPLGYAAQKLWLDLVGLSPTQARVPAAVFGVGAVFVLFWIARFLKLCAPLTLLLGFITPLLFRYSTEGRPYSQGLFFSVLSTALFLRWREQPFFSRLICYFLAALAGVYSQPFSLFVPCAHAAYLLLVNRTRLFPIFAVLALTGALYAPWVLATQRALANEAWPHQMFFSIAQVSPLMIVREISGGGYICSLSLLLLAAIAMRKPRSLLLTLCIVLPVELAIAADATFHYFFAIRQLIFVLPSLLLLATAGAMELWNYSKCAAIILAATFTVGALIKDVRWQVNGTENWGKAAAAIQARVDRTRGCVEFLPPGDAKHYYFFHPALKMRTCVPGRGQIPSVVAISPYAPVDQRRLAAGKESVGNTLIGFGGGS